MLYVEVIRDLAKKKGLNLAQLQKKAGIPKGGVYKWKNHTPSVRSLNKVATALGVSPSYLLRLLEEDKERS